MTDATAYGGSWYAASAALRPPRPPLSVEIDVDVCVIGGGLAGLTAAREIARRGWSVALLEGHRIAWNASGRNTGFVLPGFAADPKAIVERVGRDHAKALWALSETGAAYVREAIRETRMPGAELEDGGWLHVSKTDDDGVVEEQARLLVRDFGAAAEVWPAERVRAVLRSARYFGAVHYPNGFAINPLNYALGLAAAAEAAGVRIFEQTPALEIDPAGVRKRITTPSSRVRARHVVLAGNVHLDALMRRIARTLVPISTYVLVTEPLGPRLRDAVTFGGAVSDTDLADNHYRIVGGDRLMWSGRCTLWEGDPKRYVKTLLADLRRTYPQLGEVRAEYAWTGMLGNTVHRMPQIGEVSSGLWLLSGFGGHGINTTAMGGEVIARAIVDNDQTWRLFAPFELVWAGGLAGRAAVQTYYWYFRTRERIEGFLARRREAARNRAAAVAESAAAPEPLAPSMVPAEAEAQPAEPAVTMAPKQEGESAVGEIATGEETVPAGSDKRSAGGSN